MRYCGSEVNDHGSMRNLIQVVDVMLPKEEARVLEHFHDEIINYAGSALMAGLSLDELRQDLESVEELWGFGPWSVVIQEQKLFLIANSFFEEIQEGPA